jgi:hypothetical protein
VVVGAGAELATFARADIGYLLYAAERVLDGDRLYVDVVEINPPLIVALNLPAVLLARGVGASEILVYRALVVAALVGALMFTDWSLRWVLGPGGGRLRRRLVLVLAFALFPAAADSFGQREHLLIALALPYVLLAGGRVDGRPAPTGPAAVAGALAGVGLALKPHFLLLWAAVEGYAAWRVRARRPSPEALGAAAFLAVYLGGVALLTPQYFDLVRLLGPAYSGFGHDPFLHVLVTAPGAAACYLAALACAALHREAGHRGLWTVLLVALVASFVAGAAQQKGWGYHFYPSRVFALALLTLALVDVRRPLIRPVQRMYAAVAFAALGTSVLTSVATGMGRILHRDPAGRGEEARLGELVAAVRRQTPPGGSLYGMSYSIEAGFPLVNYSGVRWASRFPHLWIVEAVYHDQLYAPGPLRFHAAEAMGAAERYLNDAVHEDLTRNRPDLLMVLRHGRDAQRNSLRRLDYVGYFSRDPRIGAELERYRFVEEVGEYLLYVRADSSGQPGAPPRSEAGRYDVSASDESTGGKVLLADRAFLLNAILFLLLGVCAYGVERRAAHLAARPSSRQGPA